MFLSVCLPIGPGETEDGIRSTVDSLAHQSCIEVELVIKAFTAELGSLAENIAKNAGVRCRAISGRDEGIYDAFNLCAGSASGKYLLFLGCGDQLCDRFVVEDFAAACDRWQQPEVVYGSVLLADETGVIRSTFDNRCFLRRGFIRPWWNPCHSQGLFYRKDWLLERPFRTDLGPLADLVHTHQHRIARLACWLNRPVSIFRTGGISNDRSYAAFCKRLVGYMENCGQFRPVAGWKMLTLLVVLVGRWR